MLSAHHRKHVEAHVAELSALAKGPGTATERLEQLVLTYAEICHQRARHRGTDLSRLLHSPAELGASESQLVDLFARAIGEARTARGDLSAGALAAYAVRSLAAAAEVPDIEVPALGRLVLETLTER
jgi:hypothetical protein